jgi:hypothetical protein
VLQVGGRRVARGDWIEELLLGSTSHGGAIPIEEDTFGIRSVSAFQEISVQLRDLIGKTQIGIELLIACSLGKQCKERKNLRARPTLPRAGRQTCSVLARAWQSGLARPAWIVGSSRESWDRSYRRSVPSKPAHYLDRLISSAIVLFGV